MKSAEEWAKNNFFGIVTLDGATELVQRIQLDAQISGMEKAAEIAKRNGFWMTEETILSAIAELEKSKP